MNIIRSKRIGAGTCVAMSLLALAVGCKDLGSGLPPPPPIPVLTAVQPDSGFAGDTVKVTGFLLGSTQGGSAVRFGAVSVISVISWSDTVLRVMVPDGAPSDSVIVTVNGVRSNGRPFRVLIPANAPLVNRVIPLAAVYGSASDSAAVGDTVNVVGLNFGASQGTSSLEIGGKSANVVTWSPASIIAIVPRGATSGFVRVHVGSLTSNARTFVVLLSFRADVQPILLSNCALSGCHVPPRPTGGFDQTTYASIRSGSATFGVNVVTSYDSSSSSADVHTGSGIMKMVRNVNNPYGNFRMPQGGPYASTGLPDSLIVRIGGWIRQGARNN